MALEIMSASLRTTDAHLVALARLGFIKPADLVREGQNHKANAEYLLEMLKAKEEMLKKEKKNEN